VPTLRWLGGLVEINRICSSPLINPGQPLLLQPGTDTRRTMTHHGGCSVAIAVAADGVG
jgi:hypothetical protein